MNVFLLNSICFYYKKIVARITENDLSINTHNKIFTITFRKLKKKYSIQKYPVYL